MGLFLNTHPIERGLPSSALRQFSFPGLESSLKAGACGLAPYASKAGGGAVEACWSCHWAQVGPPSRIPPTQAPRGEEVLKPEGPLLGSHEHATICSRPHPAGHLWSHQIWAKTRMMSEVFQFVLQKWGKGRRDEKGRAEVHGLKIERDERNLVMTWR